MSKARVLLADDHRIIIEGLKKLLEAEYDVVGTVEDGRALIAAVAELEPDVVVADISMPHLNGIDAVRQIKAKNPNVRVVILTMHRDVHYAVRAFEAGASGFVLKASASAELITAIGEVRNGKTYVTPSIAGELIEFYKRGKRIQRVGLRQLSARQQEILKLLAEGHSAKEIGKTLNISARTVETHKYQIMEAFNIKTTAELVQFAIKHGIISI